MKRVIILLTRYTLLLVMLFLLTGCSPDIELYDKSFRAENSPYVQVHISYDRTSGIHVECHTDCQEPVTVSVYCDHEKHY